MNDQAKINWRIKMAARALTGALLIWGISEAAAANRWYTARTVNGRTQPLSAGTETILMPDGSLLGAQLASVSNGLVDLVISLYNNPEGDDNGNTQDTSPSNASQDAYEKIVQYFADAVYEATDGAHSIRNVRIYRNASRQDADVIWQQAGHPGAWYMNQNNIAANINMYDQFSGHTFTNAASQEVGGYTLAHEFQHYFYGVLDEYCRWDGGWAILAANEKTRPCIMNDQWSAANRTYTWLNHSILYNTNSAVYADYECRNRTAQYQHYNDGAWVILGRNPDTDPLDTARRQWLRTNRGKRMYYPELAGVAPSGTNPPVINLSSATPLANLVSRQNLNVIWMGSNMVVEIILDVSGSMDYPASKIANAKAAAQLLVDQIPDRSAVGVISFDDLVYTTHSIIVVTSAVQRTEVKNAIAAASGGGYTAIGDAAFEALSQMQTFGHTNFTRVAFLLSDGQSNTGSDPLSAAAAYQTEQIPIMTFGYGDSSEIDSRLLTMAGLTGGRYYYSPSSLASIAAAFNDALASVAARQNLADGIYLASGAAAQGSKAATFSLPFQVDATIADIAVTVGYAVTNTVTVALNSPNGTTYPASSITTSSTERLLSFGVDAPATGQWTIAGTASSGSSLRYQVNGGVNDFSYYLSTVSLGGSTVNYPDPIEIIARLSRGAASINGAVVRATVTDQNNNSSVLTLTNSAPGTYSAIFMPSNGMYDIVVQADNSAGNATYTWNDILPAATSDGGISDIAADSPVNASFTRTASLQVTMAGTDYAAEPSAPALLTASDGTYLDYVKVSWGSVYAASTYQIWRNSSDASGSASLIGEVSHSFTNYMDEAVNVGSRYYYWVKAVNLAGSSAFSSSDQGAPLYGPAIRVNEATAATINPLNSVDVTVLMRTGAYAGLSCDWWVVAYGANVGLYYLNSNFQWTPAGSFGALQPVYQGPIFDITRPYSVFTYSGLPAGTYSFYFGLDTSVNGVLDVNAVYYDTAVLTVE